MDIFLVCIIVFLVVMLLWINALAILCVVFDLDLRSMQRTTASLASLARNAEEMSDFMTMAKGVMRVAIRR